MQETLQREVAAAHSDSASAAAQVTELQAAFVDLQRDLADAQAALAGKQRDCDGASAAADALRGTVAALEATQRELRGQLERARGAAALARQRAATAPSASEAASPPPLLPSPLQASTQVSGCTAGASQSISCSSVTSRARLRRRAPQLAWGARRRGRQSGHGGGDDAAVVAELTEHIRKGTKRLEELSRVRHGLFSRPKVPKC